ncbi:MAG TPA: PIN domain-containing protein [Pseudoxanthomonas sp.]|nr:PIN domain-containing protein [Pseudoxanthomonas sp.]
MAVYDACVLYPAPLRDLLMHLALSGLYRARWSKRIHQEWMTALLRQRPDLQPADLEWTRQQMDAAVPDALVEGYQSLEASLQLPDPDDRHVLAAAIMCGAGAIVTYNLKDFPESALAAYGLAAQHQDEFIGHAFDLDPAAVCKAVRDQRASLRNPPRSVEELFDAYLHQGLATTVSALRGHAGLL